ncbi:nuclear transport factor 2 [Cordyceps militaris CM01]|uniref:NTF2-related export protein n=1 Tax=Cordyceps militaris (strain CM01) TaxID=983644 RepID=G3JFC4_CORMM|nr:nuclear transport factor 2 [Cordyceps militaris CM01]EGX93114.1 nuclear transport factor 2 [Cordyceps militaris CM01]
MSGVCARNTDPGPRADTSPNKILSTEQFIEFYYQQFDTDRKALSALYREQSMLTFESTSALGVDAIVAKLTSLPFEKVKHQVSTLDAQPSMVEGGVVILVTGQLLVDEEQRPMNYTQAFQLARDQASGQYFVFNDVFKLVYG